MQEAGDELAPRLDIILQHLMAAFAKYQVQSVTFYTVSRYAILLEMNVYYTSKQ